ncbi:MAG: hypothetical protein DRH03_08995 [Deltaproteobacteria bacterium]|nr:MAG: hypothetical protein DRH03_08995 [Deltaproteobacteria bacterium]
MHEHHDHGPCGSDNQCQGCSNHQEKMSFDEKLGMLLNHWIDHNDSHQTDYKKWAAQAKEEGLTDVVAKILEAMQLFQEGNQRLRQAQQIMVMDQE